MPYKNREADNARRHTPEYKAKVKAHRSTPEYKAARKAMRTRGVSRLTDADGALLKQWVKTERKPDDPPAVPIEPEGMFEQKRSTMLDRQGKALVQWRSFEMAKAKQWDEMWAAIARMAKRYDGWANPVKAPAPDLALSDFATHYNFGDPHLGMLAWARETGQHFDFKIAARDLRACFAMLVANSPASPLCLINELGDLFHAEDDKQVTPTAGHKLDVDGRAGKLNELVGELLVGVVDLALTKHQIVEVRMLRGNHDPYKAIGAAGFLRAWFRNEPRVTVLDNNDPFLFREFGQNLWGWHHGDGCPPQRIGGVMTTYQDGRPWGRTSHRFMATGHIHTDKRFDFPGGWSESFRTLAPADFWAHWKGFRSEQSVDSLTFHKEHGLMSRQQVNLRLGRGGSNPLTMQSPSA